MRFAFHFAAAAAAAAESSARASPVQLLLHHLCRHYHYHSHGSHPLQEAKTPSPIPAKHRRLGTRRKQTRGSPLPALTAQQEEVLAAAAAAGHSVFITGSAGTGKTLLLQQIISTLRGIHPPGTIFVTASTGIAACAIGGQTLHSFAGISIGEGSRDSLLARVYDDRGAQLRWRKARTIIIDEISMIDGELFDNLEFIARFVRTIGPKAAKGKSIEELLVLYNRAVATAPRWGGVQIIGSGDFFQLPPVKARNRKKEFAFEADCWNPTFDLQVELNTVWRQYDPKLIELLGEIRRGRVENLDGLIQLSLEHGAEDDSATRLFPLNEDVRRLNEEKLRGLGQELIACKAFDQGSHPQLNHVIAPQELDVCVGARVMLIKNLNPFKKLVNGATGVVTGFIAQKSVPGILVGLGAVVSKVCPSGLLPVVKFDSGRTMVMEPERWEVRLEDKVVATRWQIPLILAWALSVHKCQGMTIDRLHADLSRAFGCGMVYVALSRVRNLEGLCLTGFDPRKVKAHPKVLEFYDRFLNSPSKLRSA